MLELDDVPPDVPARLDLESVDRPQRLGAGLPDQFPDRADQSGQFGLCCEAHRFLLRHAAARPDSSATMASRSREAVSPVAQVRSRKRNPVPLEENTKGTWSDVA